MAILEVRIVKGGSSTIKLSDLTDLGKTPPEKVNAPQSVSATVYRRDPVTGAESAVSGATGLPMTRTSTDPAGQFKVGLPSAVSDTLDVATEVRVFVLVIMPDARRMPFEAFGTVLPAGPSS